MFLTTASPHWMGISPMRNSGCFPCEKLAVNSCATQPTVHAGGFSVSIIHRTLTWSTGSWTCTFDLCACIPLTLDDSLTWRTLQEQSLHRIGLWGNLCAKPSTRESPIRVVTHSVTRITTAFKSKCSRCAPPTPPCDLFCLYCSYLQQNAYFLSVGCYLWLFVYMYVQSCQPFTKVSWNPISSVIVGF